MSGDIMSGDSVVLRFLRQQHQQNAVKRLPSWMSDVDADLVKARRHVNQLYRWVRWLLVMLIGLGVLLMWVFWVLIGGVA